VHLRAVVVDGNTLSGPGRGASETRTVRVARAEEYDSVAVDAAPPPGVERSVLSQRMLIMLAEALQRRQPRLGRAAVVEESRRIGGDQARLRRQVGEVIFARVGEGGGGEHSHAPGEGHEGDLPEGKLSPDALLRAADAATGRDAAEALDFAEGESPVVAINRPLLEAYNAMWDAGRELDIGEPARALPHMRLALAAIQRARRAERIYLRGRPPAVVVDLARVRLQGAERGAPAARRARAPLDDPAGRRADRLAAAVALLADDPAAATDSLLLLRIDALGDDPALASALGEAVEALRGGRDATASLLRARRALVGPPSVTDSLGTWGRLP
jgi:hypothetical protein